LPTDVGVIWNRKLKVPIRGSILGAQPTGSLFSLFTQPEKLN